MNKLTYKVGNLITAAKEGEVNYIAHQANCFHTMASGIAPQIKNNFPEAYEADKKTIHGDRRKLGTCSYGYNKEHDVTVVNIYGQFGYGRKGPDTEYDKLKKGMEQMCADLLDSRGPVKIGMPMLGAGLGGGDWNIIEDIIKKVFLDFFDVTIYVLDEKMIPVGGIVET